MPISTQRWLALESSLLPNQLIVRIEHNKVVDIGWRDEVLLASRTRVDTPSAKEDDIRPTDVSCVSIARQRRSARDPDSCPLVLLGIQDSNVI
jgi:hypothetical protein